MGQTRTTMDWDLVITRNRDLLARIVAMLVAVAGLDREASIATLPRATRNCVYRILRPAEAALRRLILIAARNIEIPVPADGEHKPAPPRSVIPGPVPGTHSVKPDSVKNANRILAFALIDPLKHFDFGPRRRCAKSFPRITCLGLSDPRPIPEMHIPLPGDPVDAGHLRRRLEAFERALSDIDGQAQRLARWRARHRHSYRSPMRPGHPPGRRKRPVHEIDTILKDLHALALHADDPDTS